MTSFARQVVDPKPIELSAPAAAIAERGVRWDLFGWSLALLTALYLLLLNPYWSPGGDSEVYIAIARSIVRGEGFRFNGSKVAIAPPGWPYVLAGILWISPTFLFMKICTITFMLGSHAINFFILRRFTTDRLACGVVILSGILYPLYSLTMWMHSEALFCLLASAALLLALRINERPKSPVSIALLLVLLAASAIVRYTGVLQWAIIAAALLHGPLTKNHAALRWITVLLTFGVAFGTFKATMNALQLTPEEKEQAMLAGGGATEMEGGVEPEAPADLPTESARPDASVVQSFKSARRGPVAEVVHRVVTSGAWFSWAFWYPFRFGNSMKALQAIGYAAGSLAIGMLVLTLIRGIALRHWIWIALAGYTGALCLLWPNPNARYFVPVAPLLILGVYLGIDALRHWTRNTRHAASAGTGLFWLARAFTWSLIIVNGAMFAVDVRVARASDYYAIYEGGVHEQLIDDCRCIFENPVDARVGVSEKYVNFGRTRYSKYGVRAVHLLTDHEVYPVPNSNSYSRRPNSLLNRKARYWGLEYYLFQQPWNPWRLWHFRMPENLQKKIQGVDDIGELNGGWELYKMNPKGNLDPYAPPDYADQWPKRVPGL